MNPCGPPLSGPARPAWTDTAMPVRISTTSGMTSDPEAGQLHLRGLDLLTQVLRCPPDHETPDEDRDDREHQDRVQSRTTPPGVTSPSIIPVRRAETTHRGKRVVGAVGDKGGGRLQLSAHRCEDCLGGARVQRMQGGDMERRPALAHLPDIPGPGGDDPLARQATPPSRSQRARAPVVELKTGLSPS